MTTRFEREVGVKAPSLYDVTFPAAQINVAVQTANDSTWNAKHISNVRYSMPGLNGGFSPLETSYITEETTQETDAKALTNMARPDGYGGREVKSTSLPDIAGGYISGVIPGVTDTLSTKTADFKEKWDEAVEKLMGNEKLVSVPDSQPSIDDYEYPDYEADYDDEVSYTLDPGFNKPETVFEYRGAGIEAFFNEANTDGATRRRNFEADAIDYTFNEDQYLAEAKAHIDKTYSSHYSGKVQATELIFSSGHGVGFCVGDILKYASRFGKKNGYNRADVLKIIHYAIMLLHVVDNEKLGDTKVD